MTTWLVRLICLPQSYKVNYRRLWRVNSFPTLLWHKSCVFSADTTQVLFYLKSDFDLGRQRAKPSSQSLSQGAFCSTMLSSLDVHKARWIKCFFSLWWIYWEWSHILDRRASGFSLPSPTAVFLLFGLRSVCRPRYGRTGIMHVSTCIKRLSHVN